MCELLDFRFFCACFLESFTVMAVTFAASSRCHTMISRDYNWPATARSLPYEVLTAARGGIFDRWRLDGEQSLRDEPQFGKTETWSRKPLVGADKLV
jgi:hypothetical protein